MNKIPSLIFLFTALLVALTVDLHAQWVPTSGPGGGAASLLL